MNTPTGARASPREAGFSAAAGDEEAVAQQHGDQMPGMEYCPLGLKGVTAAVSSTGDGFVVDVTSDDPAAAAEVWRRMAALKPAS